MKKIETEGNLPPSLQVFISKYDRSSAPIDIYECESFNELINLAKDGVCELHMNLDPRTNRGYLLGFEVKEIESQLLLTEQLTQSYLYFAEVDEATFKEYDLMLKQHRIDQQVEMKAREDRKIQRTLDNAKQSIQS